MKQILSILFFTILMFNLSAQKFYLGVNTGYGFANEAGQANLTNSESYPESGSSEIVEGGYGDGIYTGIFGGYSFTRYMGVELSADYLLGRTITTVDKYYDWSNIYATEITTSRAANMLQLTPKLVFQTKIAYKLTAYAKVGVAFGLGTKITADISEYIVQDPAPVEYISKEETTGNIPVGFSTNLGAIYQTAEKVGLFAELRFLNMSYSPEKTMIVEHRNLSSLPTYFKETIYVDKTEYDDVLPPTSEPNQVLRASLPLSNMSFNFGLRVNL